MARPRTYTDGEMLGSFEACVRETGQTTQAAYGAWSRGRVGRPSKTTLEERFGSWGAMRALSDFAGTGQGE
jgi:hypothetical protein